MQNQDSSFHHPAAFWAGCAAIVLGVLSHLPMLRMGEAMGHRLAGMPMDGFMIGGMALIPAGLLLAAYGLTPRFGRMRRSGGVPLEFHVADGVAHNSAHISCRSVIPILATAQGRKPQGESHFMKGSYFSVRAPGRLG